MCMFNSFTVPVTSTRDPLPDHDYQLSRTDKSTESEDEFRFGQHRRLNLDVSNRLWVRSPTLAFSGDPPKAASSHFSHLVNVHFRRLEEHLCYFETGFAFYSRDEINNTCGLASWRQVQMALTDMRKQNELWFRKRKNNLKPCLTRLEARRNPPETLYSVYDCKFLFK